MHRIQSFTLATALAVAFTGASLAHAQTPRPQDPAQPAGRATATTKVSNDDQMFVQKAAAAGKKEVEDGKVAASKASNAQVKAYANKLVKDHTAANQQLMSIAKKKGITIDDQSTAKPADASKAGEAWTSDRGYIEAQVKAHQDAITLFEQQAKNGTDNELKAFAQKQLPGLRNHLKQAQDLQAKLSTSTSR